MILVTYMRAPQLPSKIPHRGTLPQCLIPFPRSNQGQLLPAATCCPHRRPSPPAARVGARRHMRISVPAATTYRRRATEEVGNTEEASARCHLLPRRRPLLPAATCCLVGARPTPSTPRASRLGS
ncbi:hypothetical protein GUJ93_ZPchr0006g42123 [Zizania palustris]|uniref:Uncharacterized protein n=1 Tax=Zizania palustris TaxID=103762 RepID=A0A8J5T2P3_ZIZPA|nr:hypothetical protein GUJ93_ZPchr0006g42123 [Zizania palustris]